MFISDVVVNIVGLGLVALLINTYSFWTMILNIQVDLKQTHYNNQEQSTIK